MHCLVKLCLKSSRSGGGRREGVTGGYRDGAQRGFTPKEGGGKPRAGEGKECPEVT